MSDRQQGKVRSTSFDNTKTAIMTRTRTLAIPENSDDPQIRKKYRPFILEEEARQDWIDDLELDAVLNMAERDLQKTKERLKVMVLYGSLRRRFVLRSFSYGFCYKEAVYQKTKATHYRSYSKLVAFEAARILFRLGCDVRVYDPTGLPVKDDVQHGHESVQELRKLSIWSDGHVWISPEQHGNLVRT